MKLVSFTIFVALLIAVGVNDRRALGSDEAQPPANAILTQWRSADPATQAAILDLARNAVDAYVDRHQVIEVPTDLPPVLRQRAAVFVSAQINGAPVCCMGTLYPMEADAAHEIVTNADAAAGRDLRFPPIQHSQLARMRIIVSVLGPPVSITVAQAQHLDPRTDGLVARCRGRCGVVLSGETAKLDRMIRWARIRAGAADGDEVEYFRIDDVRFIEAAR